MIKLFIFDQTLVHSDTAPGGVRSLLAGIRIGEENTMKILGIGILFVSTFIANRGMWPSG